MRFDEAGYVRIRVIVKPEHRDKLLEMALAISTRTKAGRFEIGTALRAILDHYFGEDDGDLYKRRRNISNGTVRKRVPGGRSRRRSRLSRVASSGVSAR